MNKVKPRKKTKTAIEILRDEIITDPLVRNYSGMSDQQIADDLNTKEEHVT